MGSWHISLSVKPDIVGVAGAINVLLTDINSVEVKSKQRNIHVGAYYEEYMYGMIHVVEGHYHNTMSYNF